MNDHIDIDSCTYFDVKTACSICKARPAMRKTGKCAPHSVIPYDMSRENDWVDCYEGCLKHDRVARRRYIETHKPSYVVKRKVNTFVPTPLPNLSALSRIYKHPKDKRTADLAKILHDALASRKINQSTLADRLGIPSRTFAGYLTAARPMPFFVVCETIDYLYEHDNKIKMAKGRR